MLNYRFIDHRRYFNIKYKDPTYTILDTFSVYKLFKQRYGIGTYIATMLCKYMGVTIATLSNKLPVDPHYNKTSFFFSKNLEFLDDVLQNYNLSKQFFLKKMKNYRGIRLLRGYPSHGQRTRSNASTALKKQYYFNFYYV
jgi:ribosomal protein S13